MSNETLDINDCAPCTKVSIDKMKHRSQFLKAAKSAYCARPNVIVQMRQREDTDKTILKGFTATKKIGGAVVRNRAKRRLREVARLLLPSLGQIGADYVFIARATTPLCDYKGLLDDTKSALLRLSQPRRKDAKT